MLCVQVNPELALVWDVGQKMWQRDFPGIYESLKEWPEHLKPIMDHLCGELTKKFITTMEVSLTDTKLVVQLY